MSDYTSKYDLIVFDCDGVLVDSELISNRVLAEMLSEIGLPTSTEESISLYMGRSWQAGQATMEQKLGHALPTTFQNDFQARLIDIFQHDLQPVAGIFDVLDLLDQAQIPYCVASSGWHEKIRTSLAITGLLSYFEGRIYSGSDDVPRSKPFPDLFLYAAAQMGVMPTQCAVVEDSVPGVQAGVAAGMQVYGYARVSDAAQLRAAGAHTFKSMDRLPELLS